MKVTSSLPVRERVGGWSLSSVSDWVDMGVKKNLKILRMRINVRINVRMGNPVVMKGEV
jgi:hypothetical protein